MGVPVLLLHGLGGSHRFWEDVAPRLHGEARAIDLPDGDVATKAATVLGHLSEPHLVVGHSLGGMVAQEMVLARPDLVRAVVLANTIPGATERVIALNTASAALIQRRGSGALPLEGLFGPPGAEGSARSRARLRADVAATPDGRLVADFRAICAFDAADRLAGCTVPALVLGGEHEGNLRDQRRLAELLRTELVVLTGTGHMSPAEAPTAFAAAVEGFRAASPH